MSRELKDLTQVIAIFLGAIALLGGGIAIGMGRPVAACAEYAAPADADVLHIPLLPSGSDGAKCVTIRGYFEGAPATWRYVGPPRP